MLPLNGILIIKEHLSWECVALLVAQITVGYMGCGIKVCDSVTWVIINKMLTKAWLVLAKAALSDNSVFSVLYYKKESQKSQEAATKHILSFHQAPQEFGNHGNKEFVFF